MIHHAKSFLTQGESSRFKPFKQLDRQLLWHGSRTSNYAGILSTGLRIAPPEAPVTGYMFGKGLYFADMVSKSANYTHASKQNPTGLMLLCDVALGSMHELKHADFITKLPKGKHSCKGRARVIFLATCCISFLGFVCTFWSYSANQESATHDIYLN